MDYRFRFYYYLFLIFICTSTSIKAQSLNGIVLNDFDTLVYAEVSLLNANDSLVGKAFTDMEGKFSFQNLNNGIYSLRVFYIGYNDTTFKNIKVKKDTEITFNIRRHCEYDKSRNNKICPKCKKKNEVIPIKYGLVISKNDNPMENNGKTFIAGGCKVADCDPNWYCKRDDLEF